MKKEGDKKKKKKSASNSKRKPKEQVIICRDYRLGTVTRFYEVMPKELEGKVTPNEFQHTVGGINQIFFEAESFGANTIFEGILACATFFTIYFCMESSYSKVRN